MLPWDSIFLALITALVVYAVTRLRPAVTAAPQMDAVQHLVGQLAAVTAERDEMRRMFEQAQASLVALQRELATANAVNERLMREIR